MEPVPTCSSSATAASRPHPDVTFLSPRTRVPVIGVCLVEPYGDAAVAEADAAVDRLLAGREAARVPIDTRLDVNTTGLRTPGEVEALLAAMDVVVATRLHGMVLALKNGVPALAIDPEPAVGQIKSQAGALGRPAVFRVDRLDDERLWQALDYCLTPEARATAAACGASAVGHLTDVREAFIQPIKASSPPGPRRAERRAFSDGWRRA